MPDTIDDVVNAVANDVRSRLGHYFASDDPDAFTTIETFGDDGAVRGTDSSEGVFTFVRWQWRGRHVNGIPSRVDQSNLDDDLTRRLIARPTGNHVVVQGLTVIEERSTGESVARWFVDWLSVYAQLGLVIPGRPVGMAQTDVVTFAEGRDAARSG